MATRGPTPDKARMGLPDRWLHCPKTGTLINNLFFPFKTPLCKMYDNQIAERRYQFHPAEVFSHPHLHGKKIGLWIDLTNTDRYYFREEVTEHECIYHKMKMAGRGVSPTQEDTDNFIKLVQEFHKKYPDRVVGVHCTHGFNRTGFLIAAYLFQVEEYGLDAAIGEFAENRQKGIYKQDYIDDLFARYDPTEDDKILAPEKPDWEREMSIGMSTQIDNGRPSTSQQIPATNGNNNQNGNQLSGGGDNSKLFMDGLIRGVKVCEDEGKKSMLQAKIKNLCKYNKQGFPGLQPVSLSRGNINLLEQESYMVSWKADGMRYIIYINDGDVYAFDRDNEVFEIENLDFVTKNGAPLMETLVDTEVIIDKVEINGAMCDQPRMLIYDIMRFNSVNVMKEPFYKRFEIIKTEIIDMRTAAFKTGRLKHENQIMSVRRKDFYDLEATAKLFGPKFVQHVGHEIDGLIFQPKKTKYETGRCDKVLKWKPPSHNSVDFLLKVEKKCKEGMLPEWIGYLFVQNLSDPFGTMKATATLKKYHNKIIECTLLVDNQGRPKEWKFMRERTDKSLPNGLRTAENVVETMVNPVTETYLIEYVNHALRVLKRAAAAHRHHQIHQQQLHEGEPEARRQKL
ncbi:mRNA guanylyltransferase [Caenorhabditis elegans]|uniref:mRNA-capping enzyme n=2 Tax=Caenorhabditis elegans TaxID=6239 RepID=MCE1_CAEEL|nr:mRNA guanylyltransferase [Caenorhabditis elegans]Q17607.2 RecName: Full=mRNA-capping enzyme; Includes: RecName: Full=mRNA 5'-triphosphate monophosphatase; AltName: Full=mRNA 5'-phosphatase; Includes: RecName: Full=mRNA guanylyltransferase; AltName: Full=GTP--RNA guanylyltransferase; Short=GTase [Caenorhabditis elegans]CAA99765.2 mRNA guanylyltransferase [Caenorhabditis elegans]|eukprot:NP_001020979.1 mRNA guanylyltransferase [Caenorhabditis elegans]